MCTSTILGNEFWDMGCLPISNASTGNSNLPPKHLKAFSVYFLTCIYLFVARPRCAILILALNTMKIKSILLWLVTYGFHVTYSSVFFTALLRIWITRMISFCFHSSREAFSCYHRDVPLAVSVRCTHVFRWKGFASYTNRVSHM